MSREVTACPFCSIAPDRLMAVSELAVALPDSFPVTEGHTLVILKRHVVSIFDLAPEEQSSIWSFVAEVHLTLWVHTDDRIVVAHSHLDRTEPPRDCPHNWGCHFLRLICAGVSSRATVNIANSERLCDLLFVCLRWLRPRISPAAPVSKVDCSISRAALRWRPGGNNASASLHFVCT